MTPPGFEIGVVVESADIDELNHANNVAYLRWILEAATRHWDHYRAHAALEVVAGVAWVVMRHRIDYLAPSFQGEALRVVTWVPTCTPTTCDRYAEVIRAADGAVLARSASSYCVIERSTGRPRRLDEALRLAIGGPEPVRREKLDRSFPSRPVELIRS